MASLTAEAEICPEDVQLIKFSSSSRSRQMKLKHRRTGWGKQVETYVYIDSLG